MSVPTGCRFEKRQRKDMILPAAATASTFLNESGYRSDVIERQLAHAERNKVRASYNQAEYMEERRAMMQDWADMVDTMMLN